MLQVARTTIVDTPPALDGALDDEVWQRAFSMDDFAVFKTGKAPIAKTEVQLLSDALAATFTPEIIEQIGRKQFN